MQNVLVVDDDAVTRGLLSRVLKAHADIFQVITAKDGQDALQIIEDQTINLVITDLQMPEMDGFALIAHLNEHYPEIPVFVMTAFGNTEVKSQAEAVGTLKYFEKPLNIDVITDCIFEELDSGAEGQIRGISLASFLQLVEMEKKTCTLSIKSEGKSGVMFFQKGELLGAKSGDLEGEAAAYELLCLDRVVIRIENVCKMKEKQIQQPLMNVLMEGLRIKDERESESQKKRKPLKPLKSVVKRTQRPD